LERSATAERDYLLKLVAFESVHFAEVLDNALARPDCKLAEETNENLMLIKDAENAVYPCGIFSFKKSWSSIGGFVIWRK
jgi:hypothetical protein